jgi:hypothetical protein
MMADAHYFFYHTACFNDPTIPDEIFDQICFSDCYIYGKSTGNTRIEGFWYLMISHATEQWMLFFSALETLVEESIPEPVPTTANPAEESTPQPGPATANPVEESTLEPSAATANHRWGISDVTTRSERE